jgi:hypothetical protein
MVCILLHNASTDANSGHDSLALDGKCLKVDGCEYGTNCVPMMGDQLTFCSHTYQHKDKFPV